MNYECSKTSTATMRLLLNENSSHEKCTLEEGIALARVASLSARLILNRYAHVYVLEIRPTLFHHCETYYVLAKEVRLGPKFGHC